jgi:hypothetical protein
VNRAASDAVAANRPGPAAGRCTDAAVLPAAERLAEIPAVSPKLAMAIIARQA